MVCACYWTASVITPPLSHNRQRQVWVRCTNVIVAAAAAAILFSLLLVQPPLWHFLPPFCICFPSSRRHNPNPKHIQNSRLMDSYPTLATSRNYPQTASPRIKIRSRRENLHPSPKERYWHDQLSQRWQARRCIEEGPVPWFLSSSLWLWRSGWQPPIDRKNQAQESSKTLVF